MKRPSRQQLANIAMEDFKVRCSVKSHTSIRPTKHRGYWRSIDPVPSNNINKQEPHSYIEEKGEYYHLYHFAEYGIRNQGRFASPYRSWNAWRGLKKSGRL